MLQGREDKAIPLLPLGSASPLIKQAQSSCSPPPSSCPSEGEYADGGGRPRLPMLRPYHKVPFIKGEEDGCNLGLT